MFSMSLTLFATISLFKMHAFKLRWGGTYDFNTYTLYFATITKRHLENKIETCILICF